jgi:archaellin
MAYDTNWIPIVDLELGSSVANKLTTSFNNIDVALDGLEVAESNIATNTSNIQANNDTLVIHDTVLQDHETRIDALENVQSMQYEFTILTPPMVINTDTFQEVIRTEIAQLNNGVFEYKLGARFSYDTTGSSAIFRYAIIRNDNASPTWYEIWEEPKDVSNDMNLTLFYPIDEQNGDKVELVLEARCESSSATLNISFADVIIDQKR